MEVKKIPKTELKKIKKIWVKIVAPQEFNNVEIGESLTADPNNLINKHVTANLMMLTGEMKRQNVKIKFIIKKVEEDKVIADTYGYRIVQSYAKRIMDNTKNRIEDSFICNTKDNTKLRVKPLISIKYNPKSSVLKTIRKDSKSMLIEEIKKQDYKDFINSLISYKIQKDMKHKLSKIYPVAVFEIRVLEKLEK